MLVIDSLSALIGPLIGGGKHQGVLYTLRNCSVLLNASLSVVLTCARPLGRGHYLSAPLSGHNIMISLGNSLRQLALDRGLVVLVRPQP